jgi:hypothetical protein
MIFSFSENIYPVRLLLKPNEYKIKSLYILLSYLHHIKNKYLRLANGIVEKLQNHLENGLLHEKSVFFNAIANLSNLETVYLVFIIRAAFSLQGLLDLQVWWSTF